MFNRKPYWIKCNIWERYNNGPANKIPIPVIDICKSQYISIYSEHILWTNFAASVFQ